jgi:hypothetical protein
MIIRRPKDAIRPNNFGYNQNMSSSSQAKLLYCSIPKSLQEMKDIPITESRPLRQVMRYALTSIMAGIYSMIKATKCIFTLLFIVNMLILPAHCIIGYDIIATVDSTKWVIHRSTENMLFSKEESIVGKGNFSRYRKISNIAGMNTKEQSYSLGGDLSHEEKLLMRTSEGPVVITIGLADYFVHDDENDTENVTIDAGSSADISIDEKWPAYFADYKKISYLGPGITARDYYDNNGDVVSNSVRSWKLLKQSYYRGYLNRTLIDVHIAPGSAIEKRYRNSSSSLQFTSGFRGRENSFGHCPPKDVYKRNQIWPARSISDGISGLCWTTENCIVNRYG